MFGMCIYISQEHFKVHHSLNVVYFCLKKISVYEVKKHGTHLPIATKAIVKSKHKSKK